MLAIASFIIQDWGQLLNPETAKDTIGLFEIYLIGVVHGITKWVTCRFARRLQSRGCHRLKIAYSADANARGGRGHVFEK